MTKFFSPSKKAFYAGEFRADYEAAGSWPDDAVPVSKEEYDATQAQADIPYEQLRDVLLSQVRGARETTLNRLIGIAFADSTLRSAALSARVSLLNITDVSASNIDELQQAIAVEYDRIIAAAPEQLRNAFVKLNLTEV